MKKLKLGDIAKVQGGYAYKSKDFKDSGIPVIKIKNVGKGSLLYDDISYVDDTFLENTSNYITEEGDILISMTGSNLNQPASMVGRVAKVSKYDPISLINQRVGRILLKEQGKVDLRFLYYFLSQFKVQYYLVSNATGSANQVNINSKLIESIEIPNLDFATTKKIAHILSTLDEKIELNRKMNETLESMAQAIFKSWFVDFEPVLAKAKCKSEAELEDAAKELGISKEVLALFPSEFEESELGMVPKGWEVRPFGELLSKTIGGDWGKDEPDEKHTERVKIIRGTDIPKIKNTSIGAVPTRYVETKKLKTRQLIDGDIVIEISGGTKNQPTGRTLYITNEILNMLDDKVEPASFCRLFRPSSKEIGLLLSQHLLLIYEQGKTWQYQNQSTGISNFQTTTFLENELVIVPDKNILDRFYALVRPLIEKSITSENITLQKTRDTLLPKLLSGELDVSEVKI